MNSLSLNKSSIASASAIAVLGAIWIAVSPGYVSRGLLQNVMLTFAGSTYGVKVQCSAPQPKSFLEGFLGQGNGEGYSVKAISREDARMAVEAAFPDCRVSHIQRRRSGKSFSL